VSSAEIESLREMWETWSGPIGGPEQRERFRERWWHDAITYEEDPRWPGAGTYEGKEAVAEVFEAYMEVFEGELKLERLVEAGDRAVALVRFALVSSGGDVPTDHVWGYVCRARDGKLVYLRAYWDPDEALAAVGVDSA
jgi:ketosteroid isomerase-like protein